MSCFRNQPIVDGEFIIVDQSQAMVNDGPNQAAIVSKKIKVNDLVNKAIDFIEKLYSSRTNKTNF